jgi:hypothetical protein
MPCKIEIRKTVEASIDKRLPDREAVMFKQAANSIKKYLNELWGVSTLTNIVQYSGDGGYKVIVSEDGINLAVEKEAKKQEEAEKKFERDLDFFQGDEALLEQEERENIQDEEVMLQKEGTEGSVASPATIKVLKDFLNRIGVDIKTVKEIVKDGVKQNANGAAVLTQQLVQIVNGKEDVTLGEESMHWAVEIIKQKDPKLFAKMLKEINDYAIYKQVLKDYSTDPNYQTKDGKPDILKLKTEAIGKVLSETVIKQNEGITQKPELLQKALTWWEEIIKALRSLFSTSGFDEAAMKIVSGEEIGTANDVRSDDVFYQKRVLTGEEKMNEFIDNKFLGTSKRMRLVDADPKDRHYTIDLKRVKNSVTKWIKRNQSKKFVRTDAQKIIDDQKQFWGSDGHSYIEQMIINSYTDSNGYIRETPVAYNAKTSLNPEVQDIINGFIEKLLASYPKGTRVLAEKYVYNEKEDLASTMDFTAFVPEGDSFYVEALDWKFTTIDLERTEDIPGFKQEEYKKQMGEYAKILQRYGLKPSQLRKARMIAFKANYEHLIPDDYKSPLILESIEVADLDNIKEAELYLLPVPLDFETTGNKRLDKFIQSLRVQYDKFVKRVVDPRQQYLKDMQREELSRAIRKLHLQMDFIPIVNIGNTFVKNAKAGIDNIKHKDYSTMSFKEMTSVLKELNYMTAGAGKYSEAAEVYIFSNKDKVLTDEEKQVLSDLERLKTRTDTILDEILQIRRAYATQLSVNYGITREDVEESLRRIQNGEFIEGGSFLNPEREIDTYDRMMTEGASLSSRAANLIQRIWDLAKNQTDIDIAEQIRNFEKVLLPAEAEARAKGISVFDLIATIKDEVPVYIDKLSDSFRLGIENAKDKKNKKFFIDNVYKDKYDALANEIVNNTIEAVDADPNISDEEKARRITKVKNRVLIDREGFNGYNDSLFFKVFYQTMNTDKNASKEYKAMSPVALDLWKFIVEGLNAKAQDLGYIGKADSSFFALMDATTLQKFTDVQGIGGQFKDFFKDQYTIKVNEEYQAGKTDRETGKLINTNPKYFTRTDRKLTQLSRDLTKVVPMWIKAVNEYELRSEMEDVLLSILEVEKNKPNLMTVDNELVTEMGVPLTTTENKNIDLLEAIAEEYLYDRTEDERSIGNKSIKMAFDKTGGTEEDKENRRLGTKKIFKTLKAWTTMLGTGLKLSIGIPNWFGVQFQQYINSGNFYTFGTFEKHHGRVLIPGMVKGKELGLLDLTMPLNEDVTTEERRKIAWKQSPLKWLSTFTFQDVMMVTSSFPEKRLQFANALAFIENSMVKDGKIINIRQYLTEQDRAVKYNMSESERKALENSFEDRVKALQESDGMVKYAEDKDGYTTLPGVSKEEIAKFRIKIRDTSRDMSGQMSKEDRAGYTRDTLASTFMTFKGWIPKQIAIRTKDIKFNIKQERWEYGRTRLFAKLIAKQGLAAFKNAIDIMNGTDKGLGIMQELLEAKRDEYFERTGEQLNITDEEFYDMMRNAVRDQFREMQVVLMTLAIYFAARHYGDDDDEEDVMSKNAWKFLAKNAYKTAEEVNFYYNPLSVQGFTNGNLIPGMMIATKAAKIFTTGSKEIIGGISGDQDMMDKAHFGKDVLDIVPGPSQFQKEILPLCCPDVAKAWGIVTTADTQRR